MTRFNVPKFPRTITEGEDLTFTLAPKMALTSATTIRWDIIQSGRVAAYDSDFAAKTGMISFNSGATAAQPISITTNNDSFYGRDRTFSIRLTEVPSSGPEVQIGQDHAITLIEDDTARSFTLPTTDQHETLVLGSNYIYPSVTGGEGNDTFIVTKHQNLDLTINDSDGANVIKFDTGVLITHVVESVNPGPPKIFNSITLTLGTGAEITVTSPAEAGRYKYQLGDGALMDYAGFVAEIRSGGFENDSDGNATTELSTAYAITAPTPAPNSGPSQFTVSSLPDTITEGADLSVTLTPSSALTGATDVRWDIIQNGRLAALDSDFAATTGTLSFANGATAAQTVSITIRNDAIRGEDRTFSLRLTEVASDKTETKIGQDHAITLIEDDTANPFSNFHLAVSSQDDTLVLGSSYTYPLVVGGKGNDTFIITKHQTLDLTISDMLDNNVIKFDTGVSITHVHTVEFVISSSLTIVDLITLTLGTGAEITVINPAQPGRYQYQLGNGVLMDYAAFFEAEIEPGGFKSDADGNATTELNTAIEITDNTDDIGTAITLTNETLSIAENTDTTNGIKIADLTVADTDGGRYGTLELTGANSDKFELNGTELYLKAGTALDYEDDPSFVVRVQLQEDATIGTDVTVTVTNVDETDVSVAIARTTGSNTVVAGDVYTATVTADADGVAAYSYQWLRDGSDITGATEQTYTLTDDDAGTDVSVRISYTDASFGEKTPSSNAVTVPRAGDVIGTAVTLTNSNLTIAENASATKIADLTVADADGGHYGTLELAGADADKFELKGTELYLKAGASLDHETDPSLTVRVQLQEDNAIGTDVVVTVTNVDEADASVSIARTTGSGAVASGDVYTATVTADADGVAAYAYQWLRGDAEEITGATEQTYTLTSADVGQDIHVRISYTDPATSSTKTATTDNIATAITLTNQTLFIAENTNITSAMKVADLDIADADGGSYGTLELVLGNADKFELKGTELYLKAGTAINFETTFSLAVHIQLAEDNAIGATVVVTVTNVNETDASVSIARTTGSGTVSSGDVYTATITADLDLPTVAGNYTYQWVRTDTTTSAETEISGATDQTYTLADADAGHDISVRVTYTDPATFGTKTPSSTAVSVPVQSAIGTAITLANETLSIAEDADTASAIKIADLDITDADGGSYGTLQLTGTNADKFELSGTMLSLSAGTALDYETASSLNVRVQLAEDNAIGTDVVVTVTNANETDASVVITRTTGSGAVASGDVYTATVTADLDLPTIAGNYAYQWVRTDTNSRRDFDIPGATGQTYTLTSADVGHDIRVRIDYTDPATSSAKMALSTTVSVLDAIATAIMLTNPNLSFAETTSTASAIKIGDLEITDDDGGSYGTLQLVGANADKFVLRGTELFLKAGADIDYETDPSLTVRVQLQEDAAIGTDVAVTVANVDETDASVLIARTADNGTFPTIDTDDVYTATVTADEDGVAAYSYQWVRTDTSSVDTDITGATEQTYTLTDADADNKISVRVTYTDPRTSSEKTVTSNAVSVPVATEPPTSSGIMTAEGATYTFTAEDFGLDASDPFAVFSIIAPFPTTGMLQLTGFSPQPLHINAHTNLTVSNTNNGQVIYVPPADVNADTDVTVTYIINGTRADLTITVTNKEDAIGTAITLANETLTIAEDADTTSGIKIADLTVADADGGSYGTLELAGAHAHKFELKGTVLSLKAGKALDYETDPSLNVRVQLAEDNAIGTDVVVTVTDVFETGTSVTISKSGAGAAVSGDFYTAFILRGTDTDGAVFSYQWLRDSAEITGATEYYYTLTDDDADTDVSVRVSYTDQRTSSEKTVISNAVSVPVAVDDIGTAITLANETLSIAENADTFNAIKIADLTVADADGGSYGTLELTGADSDKFELSGTMLSLIARADLDYETKPSLNVRVQLAEDDAVGTDVVVTVTNVDEFNATVVIARTTGSGTVASGDVYTATITADLDLPTIAGNYTYQWIRTDSSPSPVVTEITGATGQTYTLTSADVGHDINVRIDYMDPATSSAKMVSSTAVSVPDAIGTAITLANETLSIAENADTTSAVKIGDLEITDDDGGSYGTLELTGADSDKFELKGTVLSLKAGADIDYETDPSLTVRVQLQEDAAIGTDVAVTVTDANDAPTLGAVTGATITDNANSDVGSTVTTGSLTGSLVGTDTDGDTLTYVVTGGNSIADTTQSSTHRIDGTYGKFYYHEDNGSYTFIRDEAAINALGAGDNVNDTFTVSVSDGNLASATQDLVFTVVGTNEVTPNAAPTLGAVTGATITDNANSDAGSTVTTGSLTGSLVGADTDGDTLTYVVTGGNSIADTTQSSTHRIDGTYGKFYYHEDNGSYTFIRDEAAINALGAGDNENDTFTVSVSDGTLTSATRDLVFNVVGADEVTPNTAPTLGAVTGATITDNADSDAGSTVTTGSLTGSLVGADTDGDTLTYVVTGGNSIADTTQSSTHRIDGTYGKFYYHNTSGAYTFIRDEAAINALGAGDNENDTFTVSVSDEHGLASATQDLVFTVVGADENTAPTLGAVTGATITDNANSDAGSTVTTGSLTGSLVGADTDGDTLTYVVTGGNSIADTTQSSTHRIDGTYGKFYYHEDNGSYTFIRDEAAINALGAGDNENDTFTVSVSDEHGLASATQDLVFTVVGADENTAPTLGAVTGATITDNANSDAGSTVTTGSLTGSLVGADTDGDTLTYVVTGGNSIADTTQSSTHRIDGTYGKFYYHEDNGSYTFIRDEAAINALGATQNVNDTFTVSVSDGNLTSATQDLVFTVVGADENTAPTLGAVTGATITDNANSDTGSTVTTGSLTGSLVGADTDGDTLTYVVTGGNSIADTTQSSTHRIDGTYGKFYYHEDNGSYTFIRDEAAINALVAGDNENDTFTVSVSDEHGLASATQDLVFTVVGADENAAPTLGAVTGATITDNANSDAGSTVTTGSLTGSLVGADTDGDTLTYVVTGGNSIADTTQSSTHRIDGTYGKFYYHEDNGSYTFIRDEAAINALGAGDNENDTFTVSVSDGTLTSATRDLVFNVVGADEVTPNTAPTLGAVTGATITDNADSDAGSTVTTGSLTGSLVGADTDGDTLTYVVTGGNSIADTTQSSTHRIDGTYGKFYYHEDNGSYTFIRDEAAINALVAGDNENDTFTVSVSDEHGLASATQDLVFTVVGADENAAPTLGAVTGATITDNANSDAGSTVTTGSLTGSLVGADTDGDTLTYVVTGGNSIADTTQSSTHRIDGTYGKFYYHEDNGSYTFIRDEAAINALGAGQNVNDTFTVSVSDGNLASATQDLVFNVVGADEATPSTAPMLAGGGAATITEDSTDTQGATFTFSDSDDTNASITFRGRAEGQADTAPDTPSSSTSNGVDAFTSADTLDGAYGSFTFTRDDTAGTLTATYNLTETSGAVQGLSAGDTLVDKLTVFVGDDDGENSGAQTFTVTINGANDAPTLTTNSQAGSFAENVASAPVDGIILTAGDVDTSQTPAVGDFTLTSRDGFTTLNDLFEVYALAAPGEFGLRLKSTASAFDFETATKKSYEITVTLTDGSATATQDLTVSVMNVNETDASVSIARTADNGTSTTIDTGDVYTATVTDDADGAAEYSYRWYRDDAEISGQTGLGSATYTLVDADADTDVSVRVTYTDLGTSSEKTVTSNEIEVPAQIVNEAPTLAGTTTGEVAESTNVVTAITGISLRPTDPEGSARFTADSFTLTSTDGADVNALFEVVSLGGVPENFGLQVKAGQMDALDFETKNSYAINITVSDGSVSSTPTSLMVNLTDVVESNAPTLATVTQPPTITDNADSNIDSTIPDLTSLAGTLAGSDVDGDTLTYVVTAGAAVVSAFSSFSLGQGDNSTHRITGPYGTFYYNENNGKYLFEPLESGINALDAGDIENTTFTVSVRDQGGLTSDTQDLVFRVEGANDAPALPAYGTSGVVNENVAGASFNTIIFGPTDVDAGQSQFATSDFALTGDDDLFEVVALGGGGFSLKLKSTAMLDYEAKNSYAINVTVSDGSASSTPTSLTVNVTNVDETDASVSIARTADNGTSSTIDTGDVYTATITADLDLPTVAGNYTYQWVRTNTTTSVDTDIAGATEQTYTLADADAGHDISVRISYTDASFGEETATSNAVSVPTSAPVNNAPTLTGGGTVSITEDSTDTQEATFTFSDSDDTNASITFRGRAEGQADTAPDTPSSSTSNGVDAFTSADTLDGAYGSFTFTRDDTAGTLTATYNLTETSGAVQGLSAGDTLVDKLTVFVGDDGGENSGAQTFTVTINGANDAPTLTTNSQAGSFAENVASAPVDGIILTAGDVDTSQTPAVGDFTLTSGDGFDNTALNDLFEVYALAAPGEFSLRLKSTASAFDFETATKKSYEITVTLTDGSATATQDLTVSVMNVNETDASVSIARTADNGTSTTIDTGDVYTATVTDDADGAAEYSYRWYRDDAEISGQTGLGSATYTLVDADADTDVSVRVTYTDLGTSSEKTVTSNEIEVPAQIVNEAPTLAGTTTGEVAESTNVVTAITGISLRPTDPEGSARFTADSFTLTSTDGADVNALFEVVSLGGVPENFGLQVKAGQMDALDFETKNSYAINITVSDGSVSSTATSLMVNLTDVVESNAPTLATVTQPPTITDNADSNIDSTIPDLTSLAGTLAGSDADGDTLTYVVTAGAAVVSAFSSFSLGQGDNSTHRITGPYGTFYYNENNGKYLFEPLESGINALDAGDIENTTFTVSVRDQGGLTSDTQDLVFRVEGANDAPALPAYGTSGVVNENVAGASFNTIIFGPTDVDAGQSQFATSDFALTSGDGFDNTALNNLFEVVASGGGGFSLKLKSTAMLDYEAKSSYAINVTVSDGSASSTPTGLTVNVTNVDETDATVSIARTADNGTSSTIDTGDVYTATITADLDLPTVAGNYTYQWVRTNTTTSVDTDIAGATEQTYTLADADAGHDISVRISYTDASFGEETATSNAVSVPTSAPVNNAPTLTGGGTVSITEDSTDTQEATFTFSDSDDTNASITFRGRAEGQADTAPDTPSSSTSNGVDAFTSADTLDGAYGSFTFTRDDTAGTLTATYNLTETSGAVQGLSAGDTLVDKLTVFVGDDGGENSGAQTFTVTINGANDAPTLTTNSQAGSFAENVASAPVDGIILTAGDVDTSQTPAVGDFTLTSGDGFDNTALNDLFEVYALAAPGEFSLRLKSTASAFDFETATKKSYEITVTLTDGSATATQDLTVSVMNVNETDASVSIARTADNGTSTTIDTGDVYTATVTDDADGAAEYSYRWYRDDAEISGQTGLGSATYTLVDADADTDVSVRVTYTDLGTSSEKTVTSNEIEVPAQIVNEAPTLAGTTTGEVAESTNVVTAITGISLRPTDPEGSARFTADSFTLTSTDGADVNALFEVVSLGGVPENFGLQVKAGQMDALDFETKNSYAINITVSDGSVSSTATSLMVNLTDVVESNAPTLATVTQPPTITDNADSNIDSTIPDLTSLAGTLAGSDADGDTLTYVVTAGAAVVSAFSSFSLGQGDNSTHRITGPYGTFYYNENNGKYLFEPLESGINALDAGDIENTTFTVSVRDQGGLTSDTQDLVFRVEGANDAPALPAYGTSGVVNENVAGASFNTIIFGPTDVDAGQSQFATSDFALTSGDGFDNTALNNLFEVVASGGGGFSLKLKSTAMLDYEAKSSYAINVTVSDGSASSTPTGLTVNVTNVDETDATVSIARTADNGTSSTIDTGDVYTATITADLDLPTVAGNYTYQWVRTNTTTSVDTDIAGATEQTYTLADADAGHDISVRISYTDASFGEETATSNAVSVPTSAPVNNAPTLTGGGTVSITEDSTDTQEATFTFSDSDDTNASITFRGRAEGQADTAPDTPSSSTSNGVDAFTSADTLDGAYGSFTFTRDDTAGTLTATYNLTETSGAVQGLSAGDTLVDKLTVFVGDDGGENSGAQTFTVTINGANDAPTLTTNSQAGSFAENVASAPVDGIILTAGDVDTSQTPAVGDFTLTSGDGFDNTALNDLFEVYALAAPGEFGLRLKSTASAFDFETATKTSYEITVTLTDGSATATQDLTVSVMNVNETDATVSIARTADNGTSPTIDTGDVYTATVTDDADGAAEYSYRWYRDDAEIPGQTGLGSATYTLVDADADTDVSVRVTYTDLGTSSEKTVTSNEIEVPAQIVNEAPTLAGTTTGEVAESTNVVTPITGISLRPTDPEGSARFTADSFTLTSTDGADVNALFEVVSLGGVPENFGLQVKAGQMDALDFETKNSYAINITVSDGSVSSTATSLTVNLTDVVESNAPTLATVTQPPTITDNANSDTGSTIPDLTSLAGTLAGSDVDGDTLTYVVTAGAAVVSAFSSFSLGQGDNSTHRITGPYGTFYYNENNGKYLFEPLESGINALDAGDIENTTFTVSVRDQGGLTSDTQDLVFRVEGANDAPALPAYGTSGVVNENVAGASFNTIIFGPTDVDAGQSQFATSDFALTSGDGFDNTALNNLFEVVASGGGGFSLKLKSTAMLDYEAKSSYAINVTVSDGSASSTPTGLTVNVTNVDETDATVSIARTADNGTSSTIDTGDVYTATITADLDLPTVAGNYTYQWVRTNTTTSVDTDIAGATEQTYTLADADAGHDISVRISYTDASFGEETATSTAVSVPAQSVNEAPTLAGTTTGEVAENTNVVTPITGISLRPTDPEGTARFTVGSFTLTSGDGFAGDLNALFEVVSLGGVPENFGLQVKAGQMDALDFETKNSYAINITVSDGSVSSTATSLTVNLTDVVEDGNAPTLATVTQPPTITDNANSDTGSTIPDLTSLAGTLVGNDADGDTLTYVVTAGAAVVSAFSSFSLGQGDNSTHRITGPYGTFYYNENNGKYLFEPLETGINALDAGDIENNTFTVSVRDQGGLTSDTQDLVFRVEGANDAPNLLAYGTTGGVNENVAGASFNTIFFGATDVDADQSQFTASSFTLTSGDGFTGDLDALFEVFAQGGGSFGVKLKAGQMLDYEAKSSYAINVTASDGSASSTPTSLTITVTNVNETDATVSIARTADNGTSTTIDTGDVYTATITADLDLPTVAGNYTYQWVRTDTSSVDTDITGATEQTYTLTDADAGHDISVRISYTDATFGTKTPSSNAVSVPAQSVNEAPTLATVTQPPTITDNANSDTGSTITTGSLTGSLVGADTDGDTLTYVVTGGNSIADTTQSSTHRIDGTYGKFYYHEDNGSYTFIRDEAAINAVGAGQNVNDTFTVSVSDGTLTSATRDLVFTVVGANDAPVLNAVTGATITDNANSDTGSTVAGSLTGTLAGTDADAGDAASLTFEVAGAAAAEDDTSKSGYDHRVDGTYGNLYYNEGSGTYIFERDEAAINALNATQNVNDTFTVSVSDQGGASSATRDLVFNVVGADENTAPTLAAVTGATITDNVTPSSIVTAGSLTGTLAGTDVDTGDAASLTFAANNATDDTSKSGYDHRVDGTYGDLYYNEGSGAYIFERDEAEINAVGAGQSVNDTFTVSVSDGSLTSASRALVFTVNGANDAPVQAANTATTLNEGGMMTLAEANLRFTDADNTRPQVVYVITEVPDHGELRLSGTALTANATFTDAQISSGAVTYHHDGSENYTDDFSFRVENQNGSGTALTRANDGGGNTVFTHSFDVTGANDAPALGAADEPPVITSGAEGSLADGAVILTSQAVYDADGTHGSGSITWSLKAGAGDVGLFEIDSTSGEVTFLSETRLDRNNGKYNYEFTVIATAGGQETEEAVTIKVNLAPTITIPTRITGDDGTSAAETIEGTNNKETITTGGGGDLIFAKGKGDTINLGAGADTVVIRFESDAYGDNWSLRDGGDTINNFQYGIDRILLVDVSADGNPINNYAEAIADTNAPPAPEVVNASGGIIYDIGFGDRGQTGDDKLKVNFDRADSSFATWVSSANNIEPIFEYITPDDLPSTFFDIT